MHGITDAIAAVGAPGAELETRLHELDVQVADGKQRVASLTTDLQGALASLSARLDGLGAEVETAAAGRADGEHEVAELHSGSSRRARPSTPSSTICSTRSRTCPNPSSTPSSRTASSCWDSAWTRLPPPSRREPCGETDPCCKLLPRLDLPEREQELLAAEVASVPAKSGPSEDDLAELRLLVEGVRMRLDANEEEAGAPAAARVRQPLRKAGACRDQRAEGTRRPHPRERRVDPGGREHLRHAAPRRHPPLRPALVGAGDSRTGSS